MKKMIVSSTLILSMTAFIINFCACGNKAEEVTSHPESVAEQVAPEGRGYDVSDQEQTAPQGEMRGMNAGEVVELSSEADFNALIAQGNVVVDFYAVWCGPCKALAPVIHNLAQKNKDITFVKVNTESFPGLSSKYNIKSLPTLIFFKNGQKIETLRGGMSEAKFGAELNRIFRK